MKELANYLKSIHAFTMFGRLKPWADYGLWNETAYPFADEKFTIRQFKEWHGRIIGDNKHQTMKAMRWL